MSPVNYCPFEYLSFKTLPYCESFDTYLPWHTSMVGVPWALRRPLVGGGLVVGGQYWTRLHPSSAMGLNWATIYYLSFSYWGCFWNHLEYVWERGANCVSKKFNMFCMF